MLKHLSLEDLIQIARNGGSLEVDGGQFTPENLVQIARNLTDAGKMKVDNSQRFTAADLVQIARNGPGKVTFA